MSRGVRLDGGHRAGNHQEGGRSVFPSSTGVSDDDLHELRVELNKAITALFILDLRQLLTYDLGFGGVAAVTGSAICSQGKVQPFVPAEPPAVLPTVGRVVSLMILTISNNITDNSKASKAPGQPADSLEGNSDGWLGQTQTITTMNKAVGSGLHLSMRAISADDSWQAAFESPISFYDSSIYEPVYEPGAYVPARLHAGGGSAAVRRMKDPGKPFCDSVIGSAHPLQTRFHDPG